MGVSSRHSGWRWDEANTRLSCYIRGTEVARFDDTSADLALLIRGISGATVSSSTPVGLDDDVSIEMGDGDDSGLHHRSTALTTPWAITDVTTGTEAIADVAANSLFIWNVTQSGDIVMVANNGGNTLEFLRVDSSVAELRINAAGEDIDFVVEGDTATSLLVCDAGDDTVSIGGALLMPTGSDLKFTGTTGTNDVNLVDGVADALSIVRGTTDMMVFNSTAPSITITPATTITGALTLTGGVTGALLFPQGGTVTQGSNKSTLVNADGQRGGNIVTHNASLADDAVVSFQVDCDQIDADDVIIVNHSNGGTAAAYQVAVHSVASGQFDIVLRNISGGSLSEAIDLQWVAITAVIA